MNRNRIDEAEREYKLEILINPNYENVHSNLGLLYFRQGKLREAEALWKKTLELNPKYIAAYKYLAVYYFNQKDFNSAIDYIEQLKAKGIPIPREFEWALNRQK